MKKGVNGHTNRELQGRSWGTPGKLLGGGKSPKKNVRKKRTHQAAQEGADGHSAKTAGKGNPIPEEKKAKRGRVTRKEEVARRDELPHAGIPKGPVRKKKFKKGEKRTRGNCSQKGRESLNVKGPGTPNHLENA